MHQTYLGYGWLLCVLVFGAYASDSTTRVTSTAQAPGEGDSDEGSGCVPAIVGSIYAGRSSPDKPESGPGKLDGGERNSALDAGPPAREQPQDAAVSPPDAGAALPDATFGPDA